MKVQWEIENRITELRGYIKESSTNEMLSILSEINTLEWVLEYRT